MIKRVLGAALASIVLGSMASAATLSGTFDVTVVNLQNLNSAQSQATMANFNAAQANVASVSDTFTYTGELSFGTFDSSDATTIQMWLDTGVGGSVSDLDAGVAGLQLSKPDIGAGTATSTFFYFTKAGVGAHDFEVRHDDGMNIFDDGVLVDGFNGPNGVRTTSVSGFDGGTFGLLYVATNGDPSVLEVGATPVPLPAGLPLLAAGLGGLAALRRRRAHS